MSRADQMLANIIILRMSPCRSVVAAASWKPMIPRAGPLGTPTCDSALIWKPHPLLFTQCVRGFGHCKPLLVLMILTQGATVSMQGPLYLGGKGTLVHPPLCYQPSYANCSQLTIFPTSRDRRRCLAVTSQSVPIVPSFDPPDGAQYGGVMYCSDARREHPENLA